MEFRQLEAFVNSVQYESLSKAAEALKLTQPTVSAHLLHLEKDLGVTLLNRTGREFSLTRQGELFYLYAVDMLNTRSRARVSLKRLSEDMEGTLNLCVSDIPGRYYLPDLLGLFFKRYPRLCVDVGQSESAGVEESVMSRKCEIGITECKADSNLIREPVFDDEMVLIVPDTEPYSRWANGSSVDIKDVWDAPFILPESGPDAGTESAHTVAECLGMLGGINITARMRDLEAVKKTVAAGAGVSIISKIAAETSDMGRRIKFLKINGMGKRHTFYLIYRKGICLSPAAEAFRCMVLE